MGLTHVAVKLRSAGSERIHTTQTSLLTRVPWTQWLRLRNSEKLGLNQLASEPMNWPAGNCKNMNIGLAELTFMDEIIATRYYLWP